jgi:hypothetical protein
MTGNIRDTWAQLLEVRDLDHLHQQLTLDLVEHVSCYAQRERASTQKSFHRTDSSTPVQSPLAPGSDVAAQIQGYLLPQLLLCFP